MAYLSHTQTLHALFRVIKYNIVPWKIFQFSIYFNVSLSYKNFNKIANKQEFGDFQEMILEIHLLLQDTFNNGSL